MNTEVATLEAVRARGSTESNGKRSKVAGNGEMVIDLDRKRMLAMAGGSSWAGRRTVSGGKLTSICTATVAGGATDS